MEEMITDLVDVLFGDKEKEDLSSRMKEFYELIEPELKALFP
jgi:Trp operon repressor